MLLLLLLSIASSGSKIFALKKKRARERAVCSNPTWLKTVTNLYFKGICLTHSRKRQSLGKQ